MSAISIEISTISSQIVTDPFPPPQAPVITVNGLAIQPSSQPAYNSGIQLVVFDVTQAIPAPSSILINEYLMVLNNNGWSETYDAIYTGAVTDLLSAGNPANQLAILATFGLDNNMAPDNDAYALLLNYGAGPQLQTWMMRCEPGSVNGSPNYWVTAPVNYIFVGMGGAGYGNGNEIYQIPQGSNNSVLTSLNVSVSPEAVRRAVGPTV